jgi:catechol 2,3-dioxygenase-like lactoylglutathione lyase family enzyme
MPKNRTPAIVTATLPLLIVLALGVAGAADTTAARGRAVEAIGITVSDLDRALDFYTRVLTFELESLVEVASEEHERLLGVFPLRARIARLRLGDERIELYDFLAPEGRPYPPDSRSNDAWFQHVAIITGDMARAYAWLRQHGVAHVSSGPQLLPDWNPNAGGIRAFYFRDPDGHPLEILEFPAGKGQEKWHRPSVGLFLGIDHTAIAVADTERSLAFYRDVLGFAVAGASENWGPEQERLNAVFGARLRITALALPDGPGVELLEYLAPGDGRALPPDAAVNDLLHYQTVVSASPGADLDRLAAGVRAQGLPWVSPGPVTMPANDDLPFERAILVRDPDGHALQLIEEPEEP